MFQKTLLILAIAASCTAVHAQSTPAKKDYVARILKVQQPGFDSLARELVSDPAGRIMASAGQALQARVPYEKQEAVAKDIQADVRKFVDEMVPVVRDRAIKLAPTTIGTLLEEKFTEDELKQIATMMEAPAFAKFQSLGGEMQKVLIEKVIADTRPTVEARFKTLDETIGKRLGVTQPQGGGNNGGGAAPQAAPAPSTRAPAKK